VDNPQSVPKGIRRNVQKVTFEVYEDENGKLLMDAEGETLKELGGLYIARYLCDWISASKKVDRTVRRKMKGIFLKLDQILTGKKSRPNW